MKRNEKYANKVDVQRLWNDFRHALWFMTLNFEFQGGMFWKLEQKILLRYSLTFEILFRTRIDILGFDTSWKLFKNGKVFQSSENTLKPITKKLRPENVWLLINWAPSRDMENR